MSDTTRCAQHKHVSHERPHTCVRRLLKFVLWSIRAARFGPPFRSCVRPTVGLLWLTDVSLLRFAFLLSGNRQTLASSSCSSQTIRSLRLLRMRCSLLTSSRIPLKTTVSSLLSSTLRVFAAEWATLPVGDNTTNTDFATTDGTATFGTSMHGIATMVTDIPVGKAAKRARGKRSQGVRMHDPAVESLVSVSVSGVAASQTAEKHSMSGTLFSSGVEAETSPGAVLRTGTQLEEFAKSAVFSMVERTVIDPASGGSSELSAHQMAPAGVIAHSSPHAGVVAHSSLRT